MLKLYCKVYLNDLAVDYNTIIVLKSVELLTYWKTLGAQERCTDIHTGQGLIWSISSLLVNAINQIPNLHPSELKSSSELKLKSTSKTHFHMLLLLYYINVIALKERWNEDYNSHQGNQKIINIHSETVLYIWNGRTQAQLQY